MAIGERKKVYEIEVVPLKQKFGVLSSDPDKLIGKVMKLDMTRMLRGRSLDVSLVISKEGDQFIAKITALKVPQSYIKRMMRKNISWIEESFVCKTKDLLLRFKPFMITKKSVHRSVRKELRNLTREIITKFAEQYNSEEVFEAVLKGMLQKEITSKLRKIYPLALFEIRRLKVETPKQI